METEDERSEPSPASLSTLNTNAGPSVQDEGSGDMQLLRVSTVADQDGSAGRQGGMGLCCGGGWSTAPGHRCPQSRHGHMGVRNPLVF